MGILIEDSLVRRSNVLGGFESPRDVLSHPENKTLSGLVNLHFKEYQEDSDDEKFKGAIVDTLIKAVEDNHGRFFIWNPASEDCKTGNGSKPERLWRQQTRKECHDRSKHEFESKGKNYRKETTHEVFEKAKAELPSPQQQSITTEQNNIEGNQEVKEEEVTRVPPETPKLPAIGNIKTNNQIKLFLDQNSL